MAEQVQDLKIMRARDRSNITQFSSSIHFFTEETSRDDYEHYKGRLEEALEHVLKIDETIHDFLNDEEFNSDMTTCEYYIDTAKRALQRAGRGHENFNNAATDNLTPDHTLPPVNHSDRVITPSLNHHNKLPPIKLQLYSGEIQGRSRFREQFDPPINKDPSQSLVNKHMLLRVYLEGEPKILVESTAVVADTRKGRESS